MDLAESGLIRKLFIKGRGADASENTVRPPSCESPLSKDSAPSRTAVAGS
jgi:hypothetical protein